MIITTKPSNPSTVFTAGFSYTGNNGISFLICSNEQSKDRHHMGMKLHGLHCGSIGQQMMINILLLQMILFLNLILMMSTHPQQVKRVLESSLRVHNEIKSRHDH